MKSHGGAARGVGAGLSFLGSIVIASTVSAGDAAPAACAAEQAAADGAGTVANLSSLGTCLEKAGKLVRAEAVFKKLGDAARAAGDKDAESSAASHVTAIDARTPKLRVEVVGELGELVVELDGVALGASDLGLARPVDPGDHVIRVRKGSSVLKTDDVIVIEMSKQTYTVDVAALTGAKAAPPTAPVVAPGPPAPAAQPVGPLPSTALDLRAPDEAKGSSGLEWMGPVGTTAIAVGTVAVLTFAGLEIGALAMKGTADCTTLPNDSDACTSVGFDQLATARTLAEAGQWVGIGGAVVLATGIGFAVAYGASGEAKSTSLLVSPMPGGAALVLGGTL